jgi:hypothetical protein
VPGARRDAERLLGLADARQRLRRLPASEVRRHAHDAGMRARASYANGVRAALAVDRDAVRTAAWELGYAAGEEDAADERRLLAARQRGAAGDWWPSLLVW